MAARTVFGKARTVVAFALLGSVLFGALFGWSELPFDPRVVGVLLGTVFGVVKTA